MGDLRVGSTGFDGVPTQGGYICCSIEMYKICFVKTRYMQSYDDVRAQWICRCLFVRTVSYLS